MVMGLTSAHSQQISHYEILKFPPSLSQGMSELWPKTTSREPLYFHYRITMSLLEINHLLVTKEHISLISVRNQHRASITH